MNARIQNDHLTKEREYWERKLAGLSYSPGLPIESPREQGLAEVAQDLEFKLEPETVASMHKAARANETMVFGILLGALTVCLKRYSGLEDIVVGSPIHERYKSSAFSNRFLLLRNPAVEHMTVRELLEGVRKTLAEAYENQRYSVEALLNTQNGTEWRPFRIALVLNTIHKPENVLRRGQDATLIFSGPDNGYGASVTYDARRLGARTFNEFWGIYRHVLREMLRCPEKTIAAVPLYPFEHRQQLLREPSAGVSLVTDRANRQRRARAGLYVLDTHCDPVPTCVPGELFATTPAFSPDGAPFHGAGSNCSAPNPLADGANAPLFPTGLVARRLWDGRIRILGRVAEQENVAGYPIRPFEIEDVLNEYPGLDGSAVVVNGSSVTAYVVALHELNQKSVAEYLAGHLPFLFPSVRLVKVSKLPIDVEGGIDRAALVGLSAPLDDEETPFVAPRNSAEETMAQIWREVLCMDQVGVFDDFFELGGHSLLAMKICGKIGRKLVCQAKVVDLFNNPTIDSLSRCLAERRSSTGT